MAKLLILEAYARTWRAATGGREVLLPPHPHCGIGGTPGIEALVKALGPVGMARFLQQFDPGRGDYTAERDGTLGSPTVDELVDEIERRRKNPSAK
jgi:hypothetical protein